MSDYDDGWILVDGATVSECPPLLYCRQCWEAGNLNDPAFELVFDVEYVKRAPRLPLIYLQRCCPEDIWFCTHCRRRFDVDWPHAGPHLVPEAGR